MLKTLWTRGLRPRLSRAKARLLTYSFVGRTWRARCWPPAREKDGVRRIHSTRRDVFGSNRTAHLCDDMARRFFAAENEKVRFQEDVVLRVEGSILIEPRYSLASLPGRRLVTELQGVHPEIVPPVARSLARRLSGAPAVQQEALIHFDGFLGLNLWHFFADAFNPLLLLDGSDHIPRDLPILVNRRVWDMPIAQHLLRSGPLASRRWIVQDGDWVRTPTLYKGFATQDWFRKAYGFIAPLTTKGGDRCIFLNRRERYGRTLRNLAEIEAITHRYGFETLYAEDLTFEEQVRRFSETRVLVGIHGAGLTNMLFSDAPKLRCLELLTSAYPMPHYYWMSELLGIERYDAIFGSALDGRQSFIVDPAAFERQLKRLLD
jgi:hypothetical protein